MFSTSFKQAFSLAERVRNAGSGARYLGSNPASATSCLGQPQALLTLSVSQVAPLSKGNNDQSIISNFTKLPNFELYIHCLGFSRYKIVSVPNDEKFCILLSNNYEIPFSCFMRSLKHYCGIIAKGVRDIFGVTEMVEQVAVVMASQLSKLSPALPCGP